MPFALVQTSLDPPPPEALREAFGAVEELTATDAKLLAKDAFGILAERLPFNSAAALQRALQGRGVETELVDQRELPKLPPPQRLKRADCLPESLVLYDALGRARNVPWRQVRLIAAGTVELTQFKRVATEYVVHAGTGQMTIPIVVPQFSDKEYKALRLVLEVFIEAIPPRYRAFGREFQYAYLGDRLAATAAENFVLLVRDLMRQATGAAANRGAAAMASDPPQTFAYPTRHAFEEESIWVLFQSRRPAGEPEKT